MCLPVTGLATCVSKTRYRVPKEVTDRYRGLIMKHLKTKLPDFFLISLALATVLSTLPPPAAKAGDVGVGRRTGGIVEIDLVSAVNGSTVVRSLPPQEGAPQGLGATGDSIRIL